MPKAIAIWGVLEIALLVVRAIVQLTPLALEPIRQGGLGTGHWLLLGG